MNLNKTINNISKYIGVSYKLFCTFFALNIVLLLILSTLKTKYPDVLSNDIYNLIVFSYLAIITLIFIVFFFRQKQEPYKFNAILFLFVYFLSMFVVQIYIVSVWNVESFQILLCVFLLYIITLVFPMIYIYKMLDYSLKDKMYAITIGIIIYLSIIFDGGFLTFAYYTSKNYISSNYMSSFNSSDVVGMVKILCEVSVGKFFNYDSSPNIPSSFRIPFLIGKLLDSFLLAFIFSRIVASKPKEVLHVELIKENEELRKEIEVLKNRVKKDKAIKSKLRKDIQNL